MFAFVPFIALGSPTRTSVPCRFVNPVHARPSPILTPSPSSRCSPARASAPPPSSSSSSPTMVHDPSSPAPAQGTMTLYGVPVSNCAARCRYILHRKGLLGTSVVLKSPADVGGLKGEFFLKLNPLGKMPVLVIPSSSDDDGASPTVVFESSVICEYLSETFASSEPSFIPESAEARATARTIASLLDVYISTLHPYMYKPQVDGDRVENIQKMAAVFDAIEHMLDSHGPYAAGSELSIADACLWGNFPFYDFILPTFFDMDPLKGRPKLSNWHTHMATESQAAKDVYNEVFEALQGWWDNDRWVKIGLKPLTGKPQSKI